MIDETLLEAEEKMDKALEVAKEDFSAIRTGRATPALFNKVMVDYYGAPTPLQQLASFLIVQLQNSRKFEHDAFTLREHISLFPATNSVAMSAHGICQLLLR